MRTQIFTVLGMSCEHCVESVTAEMWKLPGLGSVDVDLATGTVRVTADRELGEAEIAHAIDEAGYELARSAPEHPR